MVKNSLRVRTRVETSASSTRDWDWDWGQIDFTEGVIRMPKTWDDENNDENNESIMMTFRNPELFRKVFHCMLSSYAESIERDREHQLGRGCVCGDILLYQDDRVIAKRKNLNVYFWNRSADNTAPKAQTCLQEFVDEIMSFVTVLANDKPSTPVMTSEKDEDS